MARLNIPDEPTFQTFTVTTARTVFPFDFAMFAKADLQVTVDDAPLSQADFTLAGTVLENGGYQGGTVTLNNAVANTTVVIYRSVTPARASQFSPANTVPVGSVDQALNRLTANLQDVRRDVARSVTYPIGRPVPSPTELLAALDAVAGNAGGLSFAAWGLGLGDPRSAQERAQDRLNVLDFKRSMDTSDSAAVLRARDVAIKRGYAGTLWFPAHDYILTETCLIETDNVYVEGANNSSSRLISSTDFGSAFKWRKASGYINGGGASNLCFINNGAQTVANTPAPVVMDGLATGLVDACRFLETIGSVHMLGASKILVTRNFHYVSTGSPTGRISMRVGKSANTNLSARQCSDIKIALNDIKGGADPSAPCLDVGLSVECTDGAWGVENHFEQTAVADVHFKTTFGDPIGNLFFANNMHDISESPGLLISGDGYPARVNVHGILSDAGFGEALQDGLRITGSVNLKNAVFQLQVDGYSGCALRHDSSGDCRYSLKLDATDNNLGGVSPLISVAYTPTITLLAGVIVDTAATAVVLQTEASFAGTIVGMGLNCTETSGIYNDLSGGGGTVKITESPGLSDFEAKVSGTIPVLANGASYTTTVTFPTGRKLKKSKVSLSMDADLQGLETQAYMQTDTQGIILVRNRTGAPSVATPYSASFDVIRKFR